MRGTAWVRRRLHEAAAIGNLSVVKLLVEKGAYVNAKTDLGTTPLERAIQSGKKEVADYLRQHGASE